MNSTSFERYDLGRDRVLAVNSNKKLKTVSMAVSIVGNLDDTVTARALLPSMLRRGTEALPSSQRIHQRLEDLYGAVLHSTVTKIGEWHVSRFRLEIVNDRFLPENESLVRDGFEFLLNLLQRPLKVDGAFHSTFFEQERNNQRRDIESLIDNKGAYAEHRLLQAMCAEEPYRIYEYGRLEDLDSITRESLWRHYEGWLRREPIWMYVTGDVDAARIHDEVATLLNRDREREGGYDLRGIPPAIEVDAPRELDESMDVQQAKLFLGYRHGITYGSDDYWSMLMMSGVLGGHSYSKLFRNVREQASLCYSVHAAFERTKGLLFIASGIAAENREQALDIIQEQLRAMQEGEITEEEMQSTASTLINGNEMLEDSPVSLCDADFCWRLHGVDLDLEEWRRRLAAVTKDDIVAASERLRLDTTYFLGPDNLNPDAARPQQQGKS